jgi:transcription antitermination factor NusG
VRKQWSDRVKIIDEPLFKSYVFVRSDEQGLEAIRRVSGVVNFVYWLGKPAVIKDADVERIKRFLHEYEHVHVEPNHRRDFFPNTKVVVTGGVFMEKEGKVLNEQKKRVELLIEGLDYKLVVFVDKEKLRVIND